MRHSGWFKAALAAGVLAAAYGCSGDGDDDGATAGAPPAAPAAPGVSIDDCASITAASTADAALTATTVAADTVVGGSTLPAHCLVQARMSPRVGADGKPYAIGFELRLPKT